MSSTSPTQPTGQHFKLLYFSTASSYTKKDWDLFTAPLPLARLFEVLEQRYPGIQRRVLGSCAVTVNLEYVDVDGDGGEDGDEDEDGERRTEGVGAGVVIQPGDEVAIIPPVSSG